MTKTQATNSPCTPGGTVRSLRRNKDAFYKTVWPALEQQGWTKIDAEESMSGKPIFVPKVLELREGQKGEDFYDDEEAVIARLLERRNDAESAIIDCYLAQVGTNASTHVLKEKPKDQPTDLDVDVNNSETSDQDSEHANQGAVAEPEHSDSEIDENESAVAEPEHSDSEKEEKQGAAAEPDHGDSEKQEQQYVENTSGDEVEDMERFFIGPQGTEDGDQSDRHSGSASTFEAFADPTPTVRPGLGDVAGDSEPIKGEQLEKLDGVTPKSDSDEMGGAQIAGDVEEQGDREATNSETTPEGKDDGEAIISKTAPEQEDSDDSHPKKRQRTIAVDEDEKDDGEATNSEKAPEEKDNGSHRKKRQRTIAGDVEEKDDGEATNSEKAPEEEDNGSHRKKRQRTIAGDVVEKGNSEAANSETALEEAKNDSRRKKRQRTTSNQGEVAQDKGSTCGQTDSSTNKDSGKASTVKSARRRLPKRSTSVNKSEKPVAVGNTAAVGIDCDAKGKTANDLSDRDGSDYHSSDDSQQERKRKRKTATATPPGKGRPRGRPRGRPGRKPKGGPKRDKSPPRGRKPRQKSTAMLDLSWKDGGKNFPKKISQVGPEYNATNIEPAGTWKEDESKIYCEQIWHPDLAEEKVKGESIDFLAERNVPHNKREAAMIGLAEVGYDAALFDEAEILDNITTKDGSEWSDEERKRYHMEIFRCRKNVRDVSRAIGKSMNSCFAYYLGTFKKTDDYRLLKSVCYQERMRRLMESEHDLDACGICGDGGNLLICDGCEGEFHMECMRPALRCIPEGKWECDECVDRAFIAAKDSLIRNSSLFQRVPNGAPKSDEDGESKETSSEGNNGSLRVRPTPPVLDIISKFAQNVSAAFTVSGLNGE